MAPQNSALNDGLSLKNDHVWLVMGMEIHSRSTSNRLCAGQPPRTHHNCLPLTKAALLFRNCSRWGIHYEVLRFYKPTIQRPLGPAPVARPFIKHRNARSLVAPNANGTEVRTNNKKTKPGVHTNPGCATRIIQNVYAISCHRVMTQEVSCFLSVLMIVESPYE